MASIIISGAAFSFGNAFAPGIGGHILSAYGRRVGKKIDQFLGLSTATDGKHLENFRVQDSRYGGAIPLTFGQTRVAGNVIWASDLVETKHESGGVFGKGGVLGSSSSGTTYTYSIHCAVAIAAGPIGGVLTIWGDSKVIYQSGVWKSGIIGSATLYKGTADQAVDPLLQSYVGGAVPAYRNIAYIVLEGLQLKTFGNRLPNLTFEIMPALATIAPVWLGDIDSGVHQQATTLLYGGMPPIISDGSSVRARRMLVGGFTFANSSGALTVAEFDVTGDAPELYARTTSTSFAAVNIQDHSWALAPDERTIAMYCMDAATNPSHRFVIFDSETRTFGPYCTSQFGTPVEQKQIAWLDAQHFVITEVKNGARGLHVFARAGLAIVDMGFFDVWGEGTSTTRLPMCAAQFIAVADGLLYVTSDNYNSFTTLYACPIAWQNNTLSVGTPFNIVSNYDAGSYDGPVVWLLPTGDGEWTIFFSTAMDMHLMSFEPSTTGIVITRPMQTLTNANVTVTDCCQPVCFGDRIVALQTDDVHSTYLMSEIALNDGAFALTTDAVAIAGCTDTRTAIAGARIDQTRLLFLGIGSPVCQITQLGIVRRCATGAGLDQVVAALLTRSCYATADFDVSALNTTTLDGYVLDKQETAASALEPLQVYEPFDLVESDGQLKAVLRGHTSVAMLPASERRASDKTENDPLPLEERTRLQELDLPVEVTIDYLDASRDYEVGSQRARRQATRGAKSVGKITLPVVCSATKAKQIAEARLFSMWAEREQSRMSLSRKWLMLNPGDVIDLGDGLMRVTQARLENGVIEMHGVRVPVKAVTSTAVADGGAVVGATASTTVNSQAFLMDLPLLRVDDDQPGAYVAISGIDGWNGATLWRSADAVNYTMQASFPFAATAGYATTALADAPCYYMDRASSVNVQVLQGNLSSCGDADLLNGANAALLGDELIQFQTATLMAPNLYALGNLLRGRRGTEGSTVSHAIGERFVLLTPGTVQFLPALLTDRNRTYAFRALSNGQTLGGVWDLDFTYALATLRPLAPAHLAGSRANGTGSDLTITWKRRARKNADWVDNIDVPLDETTELYDVEIMNGTKVQRTFASVTTPTQIYTAAQQTADWGTVPSSFTANVYQISSRYGRGQKATAVL